MSFKGKPEKLVEKQVLAWCFKNNIDVNVFDSKAVFSYSKNSYSKNNGIPEGCADILGCDFDGKFFAIELKAPGKEKVCRLSQYNFIKRKIKSGGFCLVCSDCETLNDVFFKWKDLNKDDGIQYLMSLLPKKVLINKKTINI